jgi:hypothetical protein
MNRKAFRFESKALLTGFPWASAVFNYRDIQLSVGDRFARSYRRQLHCDRNSGPALNGRWKMR